jgi:exoribonuclease R
MTSIYTVSIDPKGCKDIDDCLSLYETDTEVRIGIHISDVSIYQFNENELLTRGETIYFEREQIDMLPRELSHDKCSLIQNETRMACSVIITINKTSGNRDITHIRTLIINKRVYTYEQAQNELITNDQLYKLCEYSNILANETEYDTHKMVERYMIIANNYIGENLANQYPETCLLRCHTGMKLQPTKNKIEEKIQIFNLEKSNYKLGAQDACHNGLGLKYYTHFTSPIRRYFDILVHRQLWEGITISQTIVDQLNKRKQQIKKITRKEHVLNKNIPDGKINGGGIIIGYNQNKLYVHLIKYDVDIDVKLYSKKIKEYVTTVIDDSIIVTYLDRKYEYRLREKLNVSKIGNNYFVD